jgi:hypothetical protein
MLCILLAYLSSIFCRGWNTVWRNKRQDVKFEQMQRTQNLNTIRSWECSNNINNAPALTVTNSYDFLEINLQLLASTVSQLLHTLTASTTLPHPQPLLALSRLLVAISRPLFTLSGPFKALLHRTLIASKGTFTDSASSLRTSVWLSRLFWPLRAVGLRNHSEASPSKRRASKKTLWLPLKANFWLKKRISRTPQHSNGLQTPFTASKSALSASKSTHLASENTLTASTILLRPLLAV